VSAFRFLPLLFASAGALGGSGGGGSCFGAEATPFFGDG